LSQRSRIGLQRILARRGDPGPALLRFEGREDPHLAGEQEAQRVDRLSHPAGIGHHRDPLPLRQVIDRDVEIIPTGPWKPRSDFIIKPDLVVPSQRALHRRAQHVVAFFVGDPAARKNADDIVRQLFDKLDHRLAQILAADKPPIRKNPPADAGGFCCFCRAGQPIRS
jgi:hypothetical protein